MGKRVLARGGVAALLGRVVAVLLSPDGPASPAPCAAPLALALLLRHAASRDDHNGDEGSEGGHGDEAVSAACGALLPAVEEVAAGLGPAAVVESKRAAPGCGRRAEGAGGERHALWVAWLGLRYLHEAAAPFVLAEEAHAGGTAGGSLHAWLGGGMRGGAGGPAASGRRGVEEEEEEEEGAGVEAVARALLLGPGLARRAVAAWGGDGGPLLVRCRLYPPATQLTPRPREASCVYFWNSGCGVLWTGACARALCRAWTRRRRSS